MAKKIFAVLGLIVILYGIFWLAVPFRKYDGYGRLAKADESIEIEKPGFFSLKGSIIIDAQEYSGLVIKPGVFSGYDMYVFLRGMTEDYMIPVDSELIPLDAVNEECEILLDDSRDSLLGCLEKAEAVFGK